MNFWSTILLLFSYFQLQTFAQLETCTIFYDDMGNYPYSGWIFSAEALVETYEYGKLNGKCPSDACIHIHGNQPVMGRIFEFDDIQQYTNSTIENVQIKYHVWADPGYLIQYKWSTDIINHDWTGDWIDLHYPAYREDMKSTNHTHILQSPPIGDVLLYVRFGWPPYCDDHCDAYPDIYIDNFYLMAEMESCPEATTTSVPLPVTTATTTSVPLPVTTIIITEESKTSITDDDITGTGTNLSSLWTLIACLCIYYLF